jgi:hypothetical protein
MISSEEYASALRAKDHEVAFVELEAKFLAALGAKLENSESNYAYDNALIEYKSEREFVATARHVARLSATRVGPCAVYPLFTDP